MITKEIVARKIGDYLRHTISLSQLVDWAENALNDAEFREDQADILRDVISRLGLADVRAFGLAWEDCENLLSQLGYKARVEISA